MNFDIFSENIFVRTWLSIAAVFYIYKRGQNTLFLSTLITYHHIPYTTINTLPPNNSCKKENFVCAANVVGINREQKSSAQNELEMRRRGMANKKCDCIWPHQKSPCEGGGRIASVSVGIVKRIYKY